MLRARATLAAVLAACVGLTLTGPAAADDGDKQSLVDRIVAKADPKLMEVLVTSRGPNGRPEFKTVNVPDVVAAKRVVADLLGKPGVQSVEMNHRVKALGWNDPYYPQQWALDYRHFYFDKIWSVTKYDAPRPYVAVVDSGVQGNHPDLASHMASGYNAINGTALSKDSASDNCAHGTHVAGIIAAGLNNGVGVVGMAPRAYIRPVKVLSSTLLSGCSGTAASVARGITWAADNAHVISLSLGSTQPSSAEQSAVTYALNRGRVVIAAAGNHDSAEPNRANYPAAYSGVVGVAAVDPGGKPASFSNYGSWVDVAAPGVNIVSTIPGGYKYMSGTSMATPYVSAAAVLAIQHCRWSGRDVRSRLQTTASNYPTKYSSIGFGIINPLKLLRCQ
ncbi:MAG TPA: S8 family serine peptidase [Aeromicrobium sp.]|nr:S8 family serine peptidase [Aeromicrobium sp.]